MQPFAVAIGVLLGLLALEVVLGLMGGSLLGDADVDGPDLDAEADFEVDAEGGAETGGDDAVDAPGAAPAGGVLSWLGLGEVPIMIWFAGLLAAFGITGYGIQLGAIAVTGASLGPATAALLAAAPSAAIGARMAKAIAAVVPKSETTAISRRAYGRRRGVITVGTARDGQPAQARFTDGYGNLHYAMVVPLDRTEALPQGTEVAIVRTRDGVLKAIRLSD